MFITTIIITFYHYLLLFTFFSLSLSLSLFLINLVLCNPSQLCAVSTWMLRAGWTVVFISLLFMSSFSLSLSLSLSQFWLFSKTGEIRRDEACLDYAGTDVILYPCHGAKGNQYWEYDPEVTSIVAIVLFINRLRQCQDDNVRLGWSWTFSNNSAIHRYSNGWWPAISNLCPNDVFGHFNRSFSLVCIEITKSLMIGIWNSSSIYFCVDQYQNSTGQL